MIDAPSQFTQDLTLPHPRRIRYLQVELLCQHLYALALGCARQNDRDALVHDVAMKPSVWDPPAGRDLTRGWPASRRTGG